MYNEYTEHMRELIEEMGIHVEEYEEKDIIECDCDNGCNHCLSISWRDFY